MSVIDEQTHVQSAGSVLGPEQTLNQYWLFHFNDIHSECSSDRHLQICACAKLFAVQCTVPLSKPWQSLFYLKP